MNALEKKLKGRLDRHKEELLGATPGFVLQAYVKGRLKIDLRWGRHWPYYDLASLTKIIFTATVAAQTLANKKIRARDRVQDHWSRFQFADLRLHELWTHTAGLPWWRPFYLKLKGDLSPDRRWPQMEKELLRLRRRRKKRAVYSDPDLLVTAQVLMSAREQSLIQMWRELEDLGICGDLHFNIGNKRKKSKSLYAPTEACPWRETILQGQVHDENAFALGGIAPHAGLFGRVEDVAEWGLFWRRCLLGRHPFVVPQNVARQFTRRQIPASIGDWGWLFMKPTKARASCGHYFSSHSFGHTGFTGTSFWMDPVRDRMVILLSNRIHPTRENAGFVSWRPRLHDAVCELLSGV